MPETWYCVALYNTDGDAYHTVHKSVDDMLQYIRVNGQHIAQVLISAVDQDTLAKARITETFGSGAIR